MAYPVRIVATALIGAFHTRYGTTPCPKQLEKLLFYAEGHHLATTGEALFNEEIQAWDEGPVCPSAKPVYGGAKKYQKIPLPKSNFSALNTAATASVLIAVALFGNLDADVIGEKTHTEAPYVQTWNNGLGRNNVIAEDLMKEFFRTHEIVTTPMTILNENTLIAQGVTVDRTSMVTEYLAKHRHLEPFLNALLRHVQTEIAGPKEITVELYEDAEIDYRYLNILVRKEDFKDLGEQLDHVWENTFNEVKPNLSQGTVNLMTDFCQPRLAVA